MTLFHEVSPEDFGKFENAFILLMRVILGQCSFDSDLMVPQDDNSINLAACTFVTTFSILCWLLPVLNVRMIFHDLFNTSQQQQYRHPYTRT
jgi:hypothetical protein